MGLLRSACVPAGHSSHRDPPLPVDTPAERGRGVEREGGGGGGGGVEIGGEREGGERGGGGEREGGREGEREGERGRERGREGERGGERGRDVHSTRRPSSLTRRARLPRPPILLSSLSPSDSVTSSPHVTRDRERRRYEPTAAITRAQGKPASFFLTRRVE